MPELPEVDSYRTGLSSMMKGWKLKEGRVIWHRASNSDFRAVKDQKIAGFDRRGKFLIINLDTHHIIIHLRMTGRIDIVEDEIPVHTTVVFDFYNKKKMCLVDFRKFGKVWIVEDVNEIVGNLGIEPLGQDFTARKLKMMLSNRRGRLKPLLLNQKFIAGIGNYLADEILFRASIHPLRTADTLSGTEIKNLHRAIRLLIRKAINFGGTTFLTFRGPEGKRGEFWKKLQVFRKTGEPCPHCKKPITRIVIAQRSSHLCENKQKMYPKC